MPSLERCNLTSCFLVKMSLRQKVMGNLPNLMVQRRVFWIKKGHYVERFPITQPSPNVCMIYDAYSTSLGRTKDGHTIWADCTVAQVGLRGPFIIDVIEMCSETPPDVT